MTISTLQRAKALRASMTDAEQKLWYHLRGGRLGCKFKRQKPIGPYIVDFVAANERLVVEIDGSQHIAHAAYDERRTAYLEAEGYRVLRFWSDECLTNTSAVLDAIVRMVQTKG